MSDAEGGKKSGYRLEYAASGASKCKGPKPCAGSSIGKGTLRMGSLVDFKGNTSFAWRHWGCVTDKILANMKKSFEEPDELDGFEDLTPEDQDKVRKAWEEGHVADEDIPETARKSGDDVEEEDDEDKPKAKKAGKASKKKDEGDGKGVFKVEYASSGRSKCKACNENVGKDFFRLGHEVDFRGNKAFAWRHWGCIDKKAVTAIKASYAEPSEIEGFGDLKEAEQEKVRRAWEEGEVPEEDQGPGEAVDTGKKAAPRKKKAANGDESEKPKRSRAKKAKKDEDEEEDEEEEEEEEKPKKKRAPAKPAAEKKGKAPAKKRASKKKKEESEDEGEDFGDDIAAVGEDEDEEEEEEPADKKRKRAPPSKAASSSKPPSKRAKPAAKPPSSRGRKKQEEIVEESEVDEED